MNRQPIIIGGIFLFALGFVCSWMVFGSNDRIEKSDSFDSSQEPQNSVPQRKVLSAQSNQASSNEGRARTDDNGDTGGDSVEYFSDGSVKLPAKLLNRLRLGLVRSDLTIDRKEMALFGFTENQCDDLEVALKDLQSESLLEESKDAKVVRNSEDEVIIEIGGSAKNSEKLNAQVQERLSEIDPEKAGFLEATLGNTISNITADFGRRDRLVRLGKGSGGEEVFEVLYFDEGSKKALDAHEQSSFEMYRKVAITHRKYRSDELPDRLRFLFDDEKDR